MNTFLGRPLDVKTMTYRFDSEAVGITMEDRDNIMNMVDEGRDILSILREVRDAKSRHNQWPL